MLKIAQTVTINLIDFCGFCMAFGAVCGCIGYAVAKTLT